MKNKEIEVKFKIQKPEDLVKLLKKLKADFKGKAFERTVRFDTPNFALEKEGKFLRLRSGFKNVITFKAKIENAKFQEREEIELEVQDQERMGLILNKLGLTENKIMEKYRQKWNLDNTEIVIDKLPMGDFIEIEGSESAIRKVIIKFGLDFRDSIAKTYWDIWADYCKENKINEENIVFKKN